MFRFVVKHGFFLDSECIRGILGTTPTYCTHQNITCRKRHKNINLLLIKIVHENSNFPFSFSRSCGRGGACGCACGRALGYGRGWRRAPWHSSRAATSSASAWTVTVTDADTARITVTSLPDAHVSWVKTIIYMYIKSFGVQW